MRGIALDADVRRHHERPQPPERLDELRGIVHPHDATASRKRQRFENRRERGVAGQPHRIIMQRDSLELGCRQSGAAQRLARLQFVAAAGGRGCRVSFQAQGGGEMRGQNGRSVADGNDTVRPRARACGHRGGNRVGLNAESDRDGTVGPRVFELIAPVSRQRQRRAASPNERS